MPPDNFAGAPRALCGNCFIKRRVVIEFFRPSRDNRTDGAMSSSYYFRARRTSSSDNFFQAAAGVTLQDERTNEPNEATKRTREFRQGPATARATKRAWRARAPEYVIEHKSE